MKPSGHGEEEFAADEFRPRREWFVALAGEALTARRAGRRAGTYGASCPPAAGGAGGVGCPLRPTGRKSPGADSPPIGRLSLSW